MIIRRYSRGLEPLGEATSECARLHASHSRASLEFGSNCFKQSHTKNSSTVTSLAFSAIVSGEWSLIKSSHVVVVIV